MPTSYDESATRRRSLNQKPLVVAARMTRKVKHEAPERRRVIHEVSGEAMYFLDRMRFHGADGYEIVYERESIIAARYEFLGAVERVAPPQAR